MTFYPSNNCTRYLLWPLRKKYLAAHFFLNEGNLNLFADAQRYLLIALHLQCKHGYFQRGVSIAELTNTAGLEKRKITKAWEDLGKLNQTACMKKLISTLEGVHPVWFNNSNVAIEFELNWMSGKVEYDKIPFALSSRRSTSKQLSPIPLPKLRSSPEIHDITRESKFYRLSERKFIKKKNSYKTVITPLQPNTQNSPIDLKSIYQPLLNSDEHNERLFNDTLTNIIPSLIQQHDCFSVEKILRPSFEAINQLLTKLRETYKDSSERDCTILSDLIAKHASSVEFLFTCMRHFEASLSEQTAHKKQAETVHSLLRSGLKSLYELNESDNKVFNLFGKVKLTREEYTQKVHQAKSSLPFEDSNSLSGIEKIISNSLVTIADLSRQLTEKDIEASSVKTKLLEIQKRAHRDNVYLSCQCEHLKESIGLLSGPEQAENLFDLFFHQEFQQLKEENLSLHLQNIELAKGSTRATPSN